MGAAARHGQHCGQCLAWTAQASRASGQASQLGSLPPLQVQTLQPSRPPPSQLRMPCVRSTSSPPYLQVGGMAGRWAGRQACGSAVE